MKALKATTDTVVELTASEAALVGGGVEAEGIRPRKFGDTDYQLYVDGVLMGTGYASSTWIISSGAGSVAVSARPILPCTELTSGTVAISRSVCCRS